MTAFDINFWKWCFSSEIFLKFARKQDFYLQT